MEMLEYRGWMCCAVSCGCTEQERDGRAGSSPCPVSRGTPAQKTFSFPTKHCNSPRIQPSSFTKAILLFLPGSTCPPLCFGESSGLKVHCKVLCMGHFYLCPAGLLCNETDGEVAHCYPLLLFTRCFFTALLFLTANILLQLNTVKDQ